MKSKAEPWETIEISSWKDFQAEVENFGYREWVFRGQHDGTWGIKSSLYRLFEDFQDIFREYKDRRRGFAKNEHEKLLINSFQSSAHLYIDYLPEEEDLFEWCSIMQHYGAPTRLIDATFSPFIALYFALEAGSKDCAIFAIKPDHFTEIDKDALGEKNLKTQVFDAKKGTGNDAFFVPFEPKKTNPRLVAQQGVFLVPSTNYQTFHKIISLYEESDTACKKLLIPAKLRYEGLKFLRNINITSSALFPDIEGFCKSLRFQILETTLRVILWLDY